MTVNAENALVEGCDAVPNHVNNISTRKCKREGGAGKAGQKHYLPFRAAGLLGPFAMSSKNLASKTHKSTSKYVNSGPAGAHGSPPASTTLGSPSSAIEHGAAAPQNLRLSCKLSTVKDRLLRRRQVASNLLNKKKATGT